MNSPFLSEGSLGLLADATIKASILLLLSWVVAGCVRRSSAAVRHCIWTLGVCGLIAIPLVSSVIPGWRLPIKGGPALLPDRALPATLTAREYTETVHTLFARPATTATPGDVGIRELSPRGGDARHGSVPVPSVQGSRGAESEAGASSDRDARARWTMAEAVVAVWFVGFCCAALPSLLGLFANEWRRRRARRITCTDWLTLTDALHETFSIRRSVELRQSGASPIPLTWGVFRPVILLPDDAHSWPEPTRRVVLLHELAHVQRFDVVVQLVGCLAAALYWFHPLGWYALHRLRVECEHACDDWVVKAGERPSEYARQLLELANRLRMPRLSLAVAMARMNTLEERMTALFDETRSHRPIGRRLSSGLAAGAALLVLGVATGHPGHSSAGFAQQVSVAQPIDGDARDGAPLAATKAAGRISGRVVRDREKTPVANADVILLLPPEKPNEPYYGKLPLLRTSTDANGGFTFDRLAPGRYRVWSNLGKLTSRARRLQGEVVIVPESGAAPAPVELNLLAGVVLTVRVKEKATGKPVPNATIHFTWGDFVDDWKTDGQGQVRIEPLTAERWFVEAWAEGYGKDSQWMNLESGSDAQANFSLAPGGDLEGVVRDARGTPVEGVGLSVYVEGFQQQFEYVTSDKAGRYRIAHLPAYRPFRIRTVNGNYLTKTVSTRITAAKQTLDLAIEARPHGGSITGVVLDHNGRPIAGAQLLNMGPTSSLTRETNTGADGRFRLENLFESMVGKEVVVRAKGCSPNRVKVATGPAEKPAEITITLEPGHRISGRVVDSAGHPVDGVHVYFARGNQPYSDGGGTMTDNQGRFEFDALPAASPFIFVKEGYSEIADRQLPLDTDQVITVTMDPAGVIVGTVIDGKTNKPVREFNVRITFSPKRQPEGPSAGILASLSDPGETFQDAEGRFEVGNLVVGMLLQVTVSAHGYERRVAEAVVVGRSGNAQMETFSLDPLDPAELQTYRGRLLDAKKKPVVGAQLRLIAASDFELDRRETSLFNWQMIRNGQVAGQPNVTRFLESTTDSMGRFEFRQVPKNDEANLVWWGKDVAPGRAEHLELNEDKESLDITVPTPGRVVGTIDRKAFAEAARVELVLSKSSVGFYSVDLDLSAVQSEFEISDLTPGDYVVYLMAPFERSPGSSQRLTQRKLASIEFTVDAGQTARVEFKK